MNRNWITIGIGTAAVTLLALGAAGCGGPRGTAKVEPVFIPQEKEAAPQPPPPATAPEKEEMTRRGYVKLEYPEPGFRGNPARFTWYRFPEAKTYQLTVMSMNETVLYDGPNGAENLLDPPPAWTNEFEAGTIYFWQVSAFDEKGTPIGRSPLRDFVFTP